MSEMSTSDTQVSRLPIGQENVRLEVNVRL